MADDTTTDGQDEPTVDPTDDEQPDEHDEGHDDPDGDDEQPDAAELKTRLDEAEAEAARYKRRLIASDTRAKRAERELRELRGQQQKTQKPDADAGKQDGPDDRDRELAQLRSEVAATRVRAMFAGITKYDWQNPDAAWRLLDLDEVRQDDGTVDRDDLADAVDQLAKDNGYLLKTREPARPRGDRPTGQQPGQHRKPEKVDHAQRFRALRGRV